MELFQIHSTVREIWEENGEYRESSVCRCKLFKQQPSLIYSLIFSIFLKLLCHQRLNMSLFILTNMLLCFSLTREIFSLSCQSQTLLHRLLFFFLLRFCLTMLNKIRISFLLTANVVNTEERQTLESESIWLSAFKEGVLCFCKS